MRLKYLVALLLCSATAFAQDYFPDNDGVKSKNTNYTAFTNAKIYISPSQVIQNGTLLIKEGKVVQAGSAIQIPSNSIKIDLSGKSIYPSFVDPFSNFGVEKPKRAPGQGRSPQYNASREGFYWNDHVMPENNAIDKFKYDSKKAEELLKAGFGAVNTHIQDGIVRGTGVLVALNNKGTEANRILEDQSAQYLSFSKSVASRQSYPTSLMGSMALLRQLYSDAKWYAAGNSDTKDRSLEALNANKGLVQIFAAGDRGHALRADRIGDANGIQYAILAGGDEFEDINAIKATNASFIVPLKFPEAYDVSNPYHADYVSLEDMRFWNQAPGNPKALAENGVPFAFTLHDLKAPKDIKDRIMKAIKYGLSKEKALEALTTAPARILGQSAALGSLNPGAHANFLITSGDIFDKETTLYENWVQGEKYVVNAMDQKDIRGTYSMTAAGESYSLIVSDSVAKRKFEMKKDTLKVTSKFAIKGDWLEGTYTLEEQGTYRLVGQVQDDSDTIKGRLVLPNGTESTFTLNKTGDHEAKEEEEKSEDEAHVVLPLRYPNMAYGFTEKPSAQNTLFRNATVWTGESEGILENTDVLVRNGKISKIGKDLSAGNAIVVDASGKHLTAGIIDEHTHIAALSVNEAGHNSSAEVRMYDVVDPNDIGIYRNLAGGVTAVQLLHGSANPIGGRSAILRLKWGEDAEGLHFEGAPKFIKFALGENVKQSNWQSFSRFPQTRMGVEQVFMSYFQQAKEYDAKKKAGQPVRYDEELEVLAQILNGERFISCHSYVQSEINMLMKVAEKFNFRVNTFTHILEGYKVADKMAEHGVGGSTFSDWWAYKYEVNDAIPYNAAIMSRQGVTVAINSDDGEMSRRLNQEAAKTVKYGGMSEEEAWKMVTLNPAKLLHLDDRVGSIKEGKDADVVLWTDHPLSVYARAEKTLIQGAVYFDMETDKKHREAIKKERSELISMMLKAKGNGEKTQKAKQTKKPEFECETL